MLIHATADRELTLQEMLADPIVRAVMVRDGITEQDVERVMGAMRGRMAGGKRDGRDAGRRGSCSIIFEGQERRQRTWKPGQRRP